MKKVSEKVYYMRKTVDYLGVGLLLFLLYTLWILYKGPLSVDFLKPYIIQALNSQSSEYSMNIGKVNLELVRSIQPVKIIAKDINFRKNDDKFSIKAPSLSLSFSIRALLKGIIAPSSVTVDNPSVAIFTTYGLEREKTNEINRKKFEYYIDWYEGFLERFNSQEMIYPESFIKDIKINNAKVEFHEVDLGRKQSFNDVNFRFERNFSNLDLHIEGLLDKIDRLVTLEIGGVYTISDNKLNLDFNFSDFIVSDFLSSKDDKGLRIEVPISGAISTEIDFNQIINNKNDVIDHIDNIINKINFNVKGGGGKVLFNREERFNYGIDSFSLEGEITGGLDSVTIKNADFETAGQKTRLSLDVSGYKKYFFENSLKDLKIVFTSEIDKFKLADLSKFWPRYLAEPAWQWCKNNLVGGQAQNGKFVFKFKYDEDNKNLYLSSLDGTADIADGDLTYLEGMPVVKHVYGVAKFSSSAIDIDVEKGVSDGVIVNKGRVLLYDLNKKHNYIDIQIQGNSSITDALKFIDNPPLNFAAGMGINPNDVQGNVDINLGLNFELYRGLTTDDIKVDVKADLYNVKIENIADGKDLLADKLNVEVNSNGFLVIGDALLDGVALNLVINETFSNKAYKNKSKISFKLDDEVKKKLGIESAILNAPYIEGYADIVADITVQNNDIISLDVNADITNAQIDYSFLGFKKDTGQKGNIKTKVDLLNGKVKSVPSFSLSKEDFYLAGNMRTDKKGQIELIDIVDIRGPKTSASAKIEIINEANKKVKVNVSGISYDLNTLFDKKEKAYKSSVSGNDNSNFKDTIDSEIFIAVNSLWTNPQTPIKNFAGSAVVKNGIGVDEVHMIGNYGTDKSIKIKLDYVPRPNGEHLLSIDSNNAGSTLRVLRLYENMSGGILKIEGRHTPENNFIGHAQIRDFSIKNTPILAKLLTVASFTGMLDLLTGEGLSFSHFDAPFEYKDKTFNITDAKMFGNVIGFTSNGFYNTSSEQLNLNGVISPAYSINSFIGKIPIVGSALAGKDGTVFAANYGIKGSLTDPQISINPLSVFSPNSIKELFSSAFGGKNE